VPEQIRRIAHGMRNFEHDRLRLFLPSGVKWDTRPTAGIRGRSPRLAASSPGTEAREILEGVDERRVLAAELGTTGTTSRWSPSTTCAGAAPIKVFHVKHHKAALWGVSRETTIEPQIV